MAFKSRFALFHPAEEVSGPSYAGALRFAQHLRIPRGVGFFVGTLALIVVLLEMSPPTWVWASAAFTALLWAHVAYWLAAHSRHPFAAEHFNLMIDGLQVGVYVGAMGFNIMPSTVFLTIILTNNVCVGGGRLGLMTLVPMALGILVGGAGTGWHFSPTSSLAVQLACLPLMVVYPLVVGYIIYRLAETNRQSREKMRRLSEYDDLSGVHNRRFFEACIATSFERFQRDHQPVCLLLCDVDHFKQINDVHGHTAGDAVIRRVGQALASEIRRGDIAARYGGDEFVVLLHATGSDGALLFVERVQHVLQQAGGEYAGLPPISASFGVAVLDASMQETKRWVQAADAALYRVKQRQRGGVEVAPASAPAASACPQTQAQPRLQH